MPQRAPKQCQRPGCGNVQPCPLHADRWAEGQRGRRMGPGWERTRARVLAAAGHRCRWCGGPAAEVHHGAGGELVPLCGPCHLAATLAQAAAAAGKTAPGEGKETAK